jgi:hypothetical protein
MCQSVIQPCIRIIQPFNATSSKQAILEGRALKTSKTPTSHSFVLTDEPTPMSLDTAVSEISLVVCDIKHGHFGTEPLSDSGLGISASDFGETPNEFGGSWNY